MGSDCYHSKRLLQSTNNFSVTELELTALLVNIHGFMQLLLNRYFEYSHLIENLYVHKTKSLDTTQVKRICGRPPKAKPENPNLYLKDTTAATTRTT